MYSRSYTRAEDILKSNLDKLHAMADALIKYETIDSDQIDDIMDGKPPRVPEDWDEPESTSTPGGDSKGSEGKDGTPDSKIGGPAGQH